MPDSGVPNADKRDPDSLLRLEALDEPASPVWLRRVPLPLDGASRHQWRVAAILVALDACRGKSATVEQLHTLVWAINDPLNAEALRLAWDGRSRARRVRGYVSGLLQTLRVAQVEGFIQQANSGRQKLSPTGRDFIRSMRREGLSLGAGDQLLTELSPISSAEMTRRLEGQS